MSIHYRPEAIDRIADRKSLAAAPARAERAFGLPPQLYALTVGAYFTFLAILGVAFMNANLVIPFAIFVIYIVMAFGVPALWAGLAERPEGRFQSWREFLREGLTIQTGPISGGGAIAQVLILPALLIGWALAVAVMAALV